MSLASNLLLLCGARTTGCHGRASSLTARRLSRRASSSDRGVDPAPVPVELHIDHVYLTDDADCD